MVKVNCRKQMKMEAWLLKSNFNMQHFIEVVRGHPLIWDMRCKNYQDKKLRSDSWVKVARKLFEEFDNLGDNRQDLIIKELSKKWRNIRDSYKKDYNLQNSKSESARKKRSYVYYDALSFLAPVISAKTNNSTVGDGEDEEYDDREVGTSNNYEIEDTRPDVHFLTSLVSSDVENGDANEKWEAEGASTSQDFGTEKINQHSKKRKTDDNSIAEVCHLLKRSLEERSPEKKKKHKNEEKDEDFYFLNSLLSYTQAVQGKDKLAMRCEILQIVNKYYNKGVSENSNHLAHSSAHSSSTNPKLSHSEIEDTKEFFNF